MYIIHTLYIYTYIYIYVHYVYALHTCIHTCMHACIHITYIRTYIHTNIHTYEHTYIRTYIWTYITLHCIALHCIALQTDRQTYIHLFENGYVNHPEAVWGGLDFLQYLIDLIVIVPRGTRQAIWLGSPVCRGVGETTDEDGWRVGEHGFILVCEHWFIVVYPLVI